MSVVAGLVDFFLREADIAGGRELTHAAQGDPVAERRLLAALLTRRPAGSIPADVMDQLDALLVGERDDRALVEASALPTLAQAGAGGGGDALSERVSLWRGDLTRLRADAIVNAANSQMLGCFVPGHACIDNAIHAAAGPRLRQECQAHMEAQGALEATGSATITGGYLLPATHVIHTVGPIVRRALSEADKADLASSYRSVLDAAASVDASTVGLCSISTGVFGFPKDDAADVCLSALDTWFSAHPNSNLHVIVSLFADVDEDAYRKALQKRGMA